MKTNMLEYAKYILTRVTFDRRIFWKEYRKHISWLNPSEAQALHAWLRHTPLIPGLKPVPVNRYSHASK